MQLCLLIYMFKFTIIGDVEQLIRSEIEGHIYTMLDSVLCCCEK